MPDASMLTKINVCACRKINMKFFLVSKFIMNRKHFVILVVMLVIVAAIALLWPGRSLSRLGHAIESNSVRSSATATNLAERPEVRRERGIS
jgi:hypothetical protein